MRFLLEFCLRGLNSSSSFGGWCVMTGPAWLITGTRETSGCTGIASSIFFLQLSQQLWITVKMIPDISMLNVMRIMKFVLISWFKVVNLCLRDSCQQMDLRLPICPILSDSWQQWICPERLAMQVRPGCHQSLLLPFWILPYIFQVLGVTVPYEQPKNRGTI